MHKSYNPPAQNSIYICRDWFLEFRMNDVFRKLLNYLNALKLILDEGFLFLNSKFISVF